MIEVDAALGGPYEVLGAFIRKAGKEDASGARRYLAARLGAKDFQRVAHYLSITDDEAKSLRAVFVAECGEPES